MKQYGLLLLGATIALTACAGSGSKATGSDSSTPTGPSRSESTAPGNVKVTNVRAFIKDGQVQAFVQGELGDGCVSLQSVKQTRTDNSVTIAVTSVRRGEVCTMIFQYLNEWVALDGGFAPGDYELRANGVTARFALVRAGNGDLKISPDPGPLPQPPYLPSAAPTDRPAPTKP